MEETVLDIALHASISEHKVDDNDFLEDKYSEVIRKSTEIIILDVGGRKFDVFKSVFSTWPTTR